MKTRWFLIPFLLIFLIALFLSIFWNKRGIDVFKGGDLLEICTSPDEQHEARAYLLNGGATTAFAVRVEIKDTKTDRKHNIYYCYRCEEAKMEWADDRTIVINGVSLNIERDVFDSRNEPRKDDVMSVITEEKLSPDGRVKAVSLKQKNLSKGTYAFCVEIELIDSGEESVIFYDDQCGKVEMEWIDNQTLVINGIERNIKTDVYDSTASPFPSETNEVDPKEW